MSGIIETAAAALALSFAGSVGADHFEVKTFGPSLVQVGARAALDGDYEKAERFTRRALQEPVSYKSKAIAWANLCAIAARQGDMAGAEAACDAALQENPASDIARRNRAALRYQQGEYALAQRDLDILFKDGADAGAERLRAAVNSARTQLATTR